MRLSLVLLAVVFTLVAGRADATVYSWRDSDGALHISNNSGDVPAEQPQGLRTFTTRSAPHEAGDAAQGDPPPAGPAGGPSGEYERGVETGMRIAAQQVEITADLVRAMVPPAQPTVIAAPYPVAQSPAVSVGIVRTPARFGGDDDCYGAPCWGGWGWGPPWFFGPAFIDGRFHRHGRFGFVHGPKSGRFFGGGHGFHGSRGIFGATLH